MNATSYGSIPGEPITFSNDDGTIYADSRIQAGGGHHGHLEGGAEMMWRLNAHLNQAIKELLCESDRMRAYCCRKCGEPAAIQHGADDPSPFLKHVIRQETA